MQICEGRRNRTVFTILHFASGRESGRRNADELNTGTIVLGTEFVPNCGSSGMRQTSVFPGVRLFTAVWLLHNTGLNVRLTVLQEESTACRRDGLNQRRDLLSVLIVSVAETESLVRL